MNDTAPVRKMKNGRKILEASPKHSNVERSAGNTRESSSSDFHASSQRANHQTSSSSPIRHNKRIRTSSKSPIVHFNQQDETKASSYATSKPKKTTKNGKRHSTQSDWRTIKISTSRKRIYEARDGVKITTPRDHDVLCGRGTSCQKW